MVSLYALLFVVTMSLASLNDYDFQVLSFVDNNHFGKVFRLFHQ